MKEGKSPEEQTVIQTLGYLFIKEFKHFLSLQSDLVRDQKDDESIRTTQQVFQKNTLEPKRHYVKKE